MPSGPTLFDDDGEPSAAITGDGGADDREPSRSLDVERRDRRPNYLFRRAVVIGGVVAVVATAAIVVGNLIGTGGTSSVSGAIEADWNRVVQIDDRLGRVIVQNDQGEELERIDTGIRSAEATAVVGPTALLVDGAFAATVDLRTADVVDAEFGADRIARPSGTALTLIAADSAGQRGLLVHGPSGDRVDTTEFAPIPGARYEFDTARSTPSGRNILVTDSGNFQSVLFSFDRDEPSFFPGLALAVADDIVVTAQNVGTDATVNVFRHDGEPVSSGRTASVRAAIVTDDRAQLVTVDGQVVEMDLGDGGTSDGERLDVGEVQAGHVWTSGDRLVVTGTTGTAIISTSGEILTSIDDAAPLDPAAIRRSTCLALEATPGGSASRLTLVEVDQGTVVAETDRSGDVHASADGCSVVISSSTEFEVLDASGATVVGIAADIVALTPDATAVVQHLDGRAVLTDLDQYGTDDDAEDDAEDDAPDDERTAVDSVDLGPDGRTFAFTEL